MREAAVVRAPCGVRELGARWLAHAAARELSLAAGARVGARRVGVGDGGRGRVRGRRRSVFERTVSFVQPISSPFVKVDSTRGGEGRQRSHTRWRVRARRRNDSHPTRMHTSQHTRAHARTRTRR